MTDSPVLLPPLLTCALETERHVAAAGWDQPIRLFALVDAARFAAAEPDLDPAIRLQIETSTDSGQAGFVAVEQDDLPEQTDVEALCSQIGWPPEVDGVALALERIVLPPQATVDVDLEAPDAAQRLAEHPDRADIRLLAAVLRDGERTCLVRQRAHDSDDEVAIGADIAPGLLDALAATLDG